VAVSVTPKYCKGCGICVAFCPRKMLALDNGGQVYAKDPEKCIACRQCELRCPDLAIKVTAGKEGGNV